MKLTFKNVYHQKSMLMGLMQVVVKPTNDSLIILLGADTNTCVLFWIASLCKKTIWREWGLVLMQEAVSLATYLAQTM